jgi:2-polyprenyl-6-methoxyphenol hydroxylase-like FAD-dependent oxidoreductase
MSGPAGVSRCLIVGGGIGGMSTAITFRRLGIEVDLIDIDPDWRVYGAGITITGPSLRAFRALGVLDEIMLRGFTADGTNVCGQDGKVLYALDTPRLDGGAAPGGGGILRPVLHSILSAHTRASGAHVRLGLSARDLKQSPDSVAVEFSDGSRGAYDLVVGADGLFSRLRAGLFPHAPAPEFVHQICWRMRAPRPAEIDRRHYYLGGPVKVGLNPVSQDEMYLFLLETVKEKIKPGPQALRDGLKRLLQGYDGALSAVREGITDDTEIIYRPLETFAPWSPWIQGRVVLIGDAVHPTLPQLASGAGLAVEDALVLADELTQATTVAQALEGFMGRRFSRCATTMNNALEISRREKAGEPAKAQTELVEASLRALAEPI